MKGLPADFVTVSVKATLKGGAALLRDRNAQDLADFAFQNLGYVSLAYVLGCFYLHSFYSLFLYVI